MKILKTARSCPSLLRDAIVDLSRPSLEVPKSSANLTTFSRVVGAVVGAPVFRLHRLRRLKPTE